MQERQDRMPQEHPGTGPAHHPPRLLPSVRRITVDGALNADRFFSSIYATVQPQIRINHKPGAFGTKFPFPAIGSVVRPAIDPDHPVECNPLPFDTIDDLPPCRQPLLCGISLFNP
jgi:hypothetical protein